MWFIQNWDIILGVITAVLAPVLTYILGGRQAKKAEIKSVSADYLDKVQNIYDKLVDDLMTTKTEDRDKIKSLDERLNTMQKQFNELNIAYTREVETSQYWAKKYDELSKKYDELSADYTDLVKKYEDLKRALERHKKETK